MFANRFVYVLAFQASTFAYKYPSNARLAVQALPARNKFACRFSATFPFRNKYMDRFLETR